MQAVTSTRVMLQPRAATSATEGRRNAKRLIWAYFILLLFEGCLRKWVVPSLSQYLLVCRDPIVVAIYIYALRDHFWPSSGLITAVVFTGIAAIVGSHLSTNTPLIVEIYGLHANFLHLPLVFIMGEVLDERDIDRFADWTLIFAMPMALLMAAQYESSGASFINAGSGEAGAQLESAMGHIRPAGTFTFCVGPSAYFSLVAAFLFGDMLQKKCRYRWWFQALCAGGLLIAAVVSGSRSLLLSVALVILSMPALIAITPGLAFKAFRPVLILAAVCALLSGVSFFRMGIESTTVRWEGAADVEANDGGLIGRVVLNQTSLVDLVPDVPALGYGLGVGTNAGASLVDESHARTYEVEWERIVVESGWLVGLPFLAWRVIMSVLLVVYAIAAARRGQILALLLAAPVAPMMLLGQLGQPTVLGFTVFVSGLCWAASRKKLAT